MFIPDQIAAAQKTIRETEAFLGEHIPRNCHALFYELGRLGPHKPRLRSTMIAALGITDATLSNQLTTLRTLGLVKEYPFVDDARMKSYGLSTKGQELLTEIEELWNSPENSVKSSQ